MLEADRHSLTPTEAAATDPEFGRFMAFRLSEYAPPAFVTCAFSVVKHFMMVVLPFCSGRHCRVRIGVRLISVKFDHFFYCNMAYSTTFCGAVLSGPPLLFRAMYSIIFMLQQSTQCPEKRSVSNFNKCSHIFLIFWHGLSRHFILRISSYHISGGNVSPILVNIASTCTL